MNNYTKLYCNCLIATWTPQEGTVRLVGGGQSNYGRLEMFYDNSWSSICNSGWRDDVESAVVCTELGFGRWGLAVSYHSFGQGGGPIKVTAIQCPTDSENSLNDCQIYTKTDSTCSHKNDTSIICTGKCYNPLE